MEYTIDATNKKLGRIATEAAMVLMGKKSTSYAPNKVLSVKVIISNAEKMDVSTKKLTEKEYVRYSGYPGGLRFESLSDVVEKKGFSEAIRLAVYGMLPANKLRKPRLKNLIITE